MKKGTKSSPMETHLRELGACRRCPEVLAPPVVGTVSKARIMLIGQAPGPKEREVGRPFAWTAGRTLFKWFATLGVEEEMIRSRVFMGSLIRCFPGKIPGKGGDRRPSRQEAAQCAEHFDQEVALLKPELLIPVGRMAIERFVPGKKLDQVVGRVFPTTWNSHSFDCVPLPHPSGLSRWIQTDEGKARITQALGLMAQHPAWKATFLPPG